MKVIKMNPKGEGDSNWKMVFKTQNPVQADIVAGNLENNGIHVVTINKRDSSYTVFGFIELYVHEDEFDAATKLIEELRMRNFWQRTITGAFFVVVLLGAVLWNGFSFIALCFTICVLGLREYAILFNNRKYKPDFWGTVIGGTGIALLLTMYALHIIDHIPGPEKYLWLIGSLLIPAVNEIKFAKDSSFKNLALSYAGIAYINSGVFCFESIAVGGASGGYNPQIVLGFLIILWSSDTFAYLTGRAFGKTPLAPKISPKKTWEGSIGGAICTLGVAYILFWTIGRLNMTEWFLFALIIIVFGTIGDLIESRFKRVLGVKDSGNILPGHGGILDRFDSLLFAAPFVLIFLKIISIYY